MSSDKESEGDLITQSCARTLAGLLVERVRRSPQATAYLEFDHASGRWTPWTWACIEARASRMQHAMEAEGLRPGDRVALLLPNSTDWVCFDMAALGLALVVVPLYAHDSEANIIRILTESDARLVLLDTQERATRILSQTDQLPDLSVWIRESDAGPAGSGTPHRANQLERVISRYRETPLKCRCEPGSLATIIYTSGTTGRPKGTMLTHSAILCNAEGVTTLVAPTREDVLLSFLPLAHAFERTVGYYLPIMGGSTVAYARSIEQLQSDLTSIRPTILIGVPRFYERICAAIHATASASAIKIRLLDLTYSIGSQRFEASQGRGPHPGAVSRLLWWFLDRVIARRIRELFGGRLRVAVTGGASMPQKAAGFLLAMGVPLLGGYGLTEAAPVVTGTSPDDNLPQSVGRPLPGIELAIGKDNELLVKTPAVMRGYWKDEAQTAKAIDAAGWLHTGDIAEIREGRLFILGRLKDVLALSTGEKVSANLVEDIIREDEIIDQVMIVSEGRPYTTAVCVLDKKRWRELSARLRLDPENPNAPAAIAELLSRIGLRLNEQPRHAQVRGVHLTLSPWTVENGLLTPTLKVRRSAVEELFRREIDALYEGHGTFLGATG